VGLKEGGVWKQEERHFVMIKAIKAACLSSVKSPHFLFLQNKKIGANIHKIILKFILKTEC
jgi:hypothetical protein